MQTKKIALITGGARRIGAAIATTLHASGYQIIIHYHTSANAAYALCQYFNQTRLNSAICLQADLNCPNQLNGFIKQALAHWGQLDALINNASYFFKTPLNEACASQWQMLFSTHVAAPFVLAQQTQKALTAAQGQIINIVDIHGLQALPDYSLYSCAKASLIMLTKALALELAPNIRVNAIAPGAIRWPENGNALSDSQKEKILTKIPLQQTGDPADIANLCLFLLEKGSYINSQIIAVDGGRGIYYK